jgi:hypothetical protein
MPNKFKLKKNTGQLILANIFIFSKLNYKNVKKKGPLAEASSFRRVTFRMTILKTR